MAKKKIGTKKKRSSEKKTTHKKRAIRAPRSIRASSLTDVPRGHALDRATAIIRYAHETSAAFLDAFQRIRRSRRAGGAPTDEEQDILRAMLVMSAAGVDSMIKQLIRDALPTLVNCDEKVLNGLEKFVTRQIRGDSNNTEARSGAGFLARILVAKSQQEQVIEEYIYDLTGSSLQSADELMKAASALGLERHDVGIEPNNVQKTFNIRNKIIHELDINFDAARRNRESRTQTDMIRMTNELLEIGEQFVTCVTPKLINSG